jgi:hypothetical protein
MTDDKLARGHAMTGDERAFSGVDILFKNGLRFAICHPSFVIQTSFKRV